MLGHSANLDIDRDGHDPEGADPGAARMNQQAHPQRADLRTAQQREQSRPPAGRSIEFGEQAARIRFALVDRRACLRRRTRIGQRLGKQAPPEGVRSVALADTR